ncbi:uncharacterized protein METZ01_LOCUS320004, partial [marine metagenome]
VKQNTGRDISKILSIFCQIQKKMVDLHSNFYDLESILFINKI